MDEQPERLSLTNIKEGAAVEMFDLQLDKVLANINDINTDLKARSITLTLNLTPNDDRTLLTIALDCTSKIRHQEKQKAYADIKIDERGRAFAVERRQQQRTLFPAVVLPMKGDQK